MIYKKRKVFQVYKLGKNGKHIQLGGAIAINKKNALKQVQNVWGSKKVKIGRVLK